MQKYIFITKSDQMSYKLNKYSDDMMFTLYMCLTDGLGTESYINFLEDCARVRFSGNICSMIKLDDMISLSIDEGIIPNLPIFNSSIDNLIKIYKEINRLKDLGVNKIYITLDNDVLTISGD